MLKLEKTVENLLIIMQPPSGGCVLKQKYKPLLLTKHNAATFGWLCVETEEEIQSMNEPKQPPSGGCVLKHRPGNTTSHRCAAATFGWLCVETFQIQLLRMGQIAATFGWLCVETPLAFGLCTTYGGSRLWAAVC